MELAEAVVPHLTRDLLESRLDLAQALPRVCDQIARWNGMAAISPADL